MPDERTDDPLTALLRAADPAAGDPGLDPRERALVRQRLLDTGHERRRHTAGWLLPAATAMALLALGLGLGLNQPRAPLPGTTTERPAAPLTTAAVNAVAGAAAGQQIQFTTDNGTLVVWVLQPRATS